MKDPLVAELTYRETVGAREHVRAIQRAIMLPLRLVATVDLAGAIVVLFISRFRLLAFFAPAYAVALVASAWFYRRYAAANGLLLPVRPWVLILVSSLAGGVTMSRLGVALQKPGVSDFGPCLSLAVGTALTAFWLRSPRLAIAAITMATSTALVSLVAEGDIAVALQLAAIGVILWSASLTIPDHEGPA